jgi:hypothetical protein
LGNHRAENGATRASLLAAMRASPTPQPAHTMPFIVQGIDSGFVDHIRNGE